MVAIGSPANGASFSASTNVVVTGAVLDYDTATTNLAFLVNGNVVSQYAPTTNYYLSSPTNFFFSWNPGAASPQTTYAFFSFTLTTNLTTNTAGFYKLTVMASDSYGYVSSSDSLTPLTVILTNSFTATNNLIASLDNLPMSTNAIGTISYTVISNGFFDLQGKARDPISTDPGANPTRNASPLLCVASAAANNGASVETEPSINPARPGWITCKTNNRFSRAESSSLTLVSAICSAACA